MLAGFRRDRQRRAETTQAIHTYHAAAFRDRSRCNIKGATEAHKLRGTARSVRLDQSINALVRSIRLATRVSTSCSGKSFFFCHRDGGASIVRTQHSHRVVEQIRTALLLDAKRTFVTQAACNEGELVISMPSAARWVWNRNEGQSV